MINFEIGLRLSDAQLKSGLAGVRSELEKAFTVRNKDGSISKEIAAAAYQAKALEKALTAATTNKGISYAQLNVELAKAGTSAGKLTAALAAGGSTFNSSLNTANNALALSNRQVLSLNKTLQEAGRVFKQSLKFTVAQTAIRAISTEVRESIQWVKALNDAVNEIAVVTGKTGAEIDSVTEAAVKGSKELRIAAEEYAKGALIFYQQGLNDEEVIRRNEITIKAAKAANQSIDEMSKQLTAIWNTYGMVGDEQMRAASVGAKMAAQTAVDFSDIAQAMQAAAAPAAQMGVEYNQLAAIIATVGDATQQSASIIGNAYKTIFSRFQQLVSDGTDGEVTLGAVSQKLQNLGIQLLNSDGSLKNLGQTINEVGQNWDNWSESQQLAIAQLVGGTRQYGQFLSLMQNFDKYQKNLKSASLETGSTLEQQYTQALDSIESRAENAAEAWHRAFSNVFNADQIKGLYKGIEMAGEATRAFLEAIGGAPGIFMAIATLLSGKIVPSLATAINMGKQFGLSLTPNGRESTIKKDFAEQRTRIDNSTTMTEDQKAIATSKANFSERTAMTNERINQQLKTATGEYRVQLEMQKQMLETAQKNYQESLDEENALKRKVELEGIRLNKLREALEVITETQAINQQELQTATTSQVDALNERKAAQRELDSLLNVQGHQFTGSAEMKQKMINQEESMTRPGVDENTFNNTLRNYNELQARIDKVVAAEERLKQAIQAVAQAEQAVAAAQQKVNADQEAKKVADLAQKYNEIAQAVAKYDQAKMLPGGGGAEYDEVVKRIEEYIALAPEASKEVEELKKRLEGLKSAEQGVSLEHVLEGVQNVNADTNVDTLDVNGTPATRNADALIDAHLRNEQAIREQEEAQKKLREQQSLTLQQGISAAVQFGMVLSSVTMAVKNLIAVWSDDSDATAFEKIGKSLSIIGTTAIMAIPGILGVISAVTTLGTTAEVTGMAAFKAGLMAQTGLGPLLPVVLAITLAVAGLVVVIGLIADSIKKADPSYQLQQAQEDAAAFAESLNDAKQEAEELKKAFDSYDEVQDKLKNCTVGTEEWKEALKEANNQVLELIRKYPELASAVDSSMVNGQRMLTINKEGMQALQAQQDAIVTNLSAASVSANQRVRDAELAVQKRDIVKEIGYGSLTSTTQTNSPYGNGSYQLNKTGAVIDKYIKDILSSTPDQMEALAERIIEEQNLDQSVESVKKTLEGMIPSLKEYDAAIVAAAESKKIENDIIADSIIQNNKRFSGYKDSNAMAASGAIYGNAYEKAYKEALRKAQSRGAFNTGTADSIKSFEDYAKGLGLKDWKATNYKGSGADASVEYTYYDDEGKKQTAEATAEMIARFNAAAQAGEELETTLINLIQQTDKLAASFDTGDQALSTFLGNGNLEGATQGQFNDIKTDVAGFDNVEAYLQSKFGEDLSEIAATAGYNSAEEFVTAFEDSLKIDWSIIPEELQKYEGINLAQAKKMAEVYEIAIADGGEAAAKAYTDGLDYVLKDVSQKDMKKVLEGLSNVNWSDWDAGKNVVKMMEELGYTIDTSTKEWNNFTDSMRDSFDAVPDLEALNEQLEKVKDIASDISLGDIISKEDYETLKDFNNELERYFAILSDGSAQFIGDPLDFQQEVQKSGKKALQDAAKELQDAAEEAKAQYDEALKAAGGTKESLQALRQSQNRVVVDEESGESSNHYYIRDVAEQIAFLESMNFDTDKIEEWKKAITLDENGEYHSTVEALEEIGNAVDEMAPEWERAGVSAAEYQEQVQGIANQIATQAESFEQLREDLDELNLTSEQFKVAFSAGMSSMINTERWDGLDVDEVKKYAKYLQEAGYKSDMLADSLQDDEEAAEDVARATKKLNQGIDKLANGFEDWSSILKKSDAGSEEYCTALGEMQNAMSDILDISEDFLSADFLLKNMEDIKLAAEGDADAIDRLRQAALEDIVMHINLDDSELTNDELWARVQGLQSMLDEMFPDGIEVGTSINLEGLGEGEADFIETLNDLILEAGMGADEVNAMLSGMGFTANFATEPQEVTKTVPPLMGVKHYVKDRYTTEEGVEEYTTWEEPIEIRPAEVKTFTEDAFSLETSEPGTKVIPKINSITKTGSGKMNNYSSSNSGGTTTPGGGTKKDKSGGGGSDKKFKKKDREEKDDQKFHKRYENLTNAIEELNDALQHTSNAQNDAWGPAKLRQMDTYILKIQKLAKLQKALIQETKDYYKKDKAALLATSVGSMAKFDDGEYGDLLNPEDLRRTLQAKYEEALEAYNKAIDDYNDAADTADGADAGVEAQKELYDEMVKSLEKDIKALDQFLETRDLLRERMEQQLDYIRDWMSKKVEKIQYEIDMRIRIPQRDIKQLERFISRVEDIGIETDSSFAAVRAKWDKTIESMQATWGNDGTDGEVKSGIYRALEILENIDPNNPEHQAYFEKTFGKEAWQEYLKDTSAVPEVVIDKIHELYDQLLDYQEQLYDIAQETFDMLARKIEMWFEKLDKIQDKLDTHLTRLEMLQSIVDASNIAGSQAGRDATRQINESKKKNAWTSAHVSEATYLGAKQVYEDLDKQYNEILAERNALGEANDDNMEEIKAYEFVLKNLKNERDKAYEDMTAAEQERNQKIGEAAAMMKEMLNQEFEMLTTEFEIGLNGLFATLEGAIQMFDDMAEVRDWYLDPFEKDYEFQSLLNKIDKEIEGTNDPEYLKKLMDMRQKIIEKQAEGRDITQEEFDIDNKRFELLQAQAAFEEAQNAKNKNTMRLQRDASGNYSYVYSDDEKQADDLKQKVLDAEHNLYEAEKAAERAMDRMYYQQLQKLEQLKIKRQQALAEGDMELVAECDRLIELATTTLDRIAADEGRFSEMLREDFGDNAAELNKSISAMIADYDTLQEAEEVHKNKLIEFEEQMTAATEQMQADMERELLELGIDYKNLAQTVKTETDNINRENEEMKNEVTKMKNQGLKDLSEYTNAINSWARNFITQMQAIIQKLKELMKAIEEAEKKAASANLDPNNDILNTDWQAKIIEANKNGDYDAADEYTANRDKKDELMGGDYISSHGYMSQDMNRAINEAIRNGDLTGKDQENVNTIINAYARAKGDANKLYEYLKNIDVGTVRNTIASQTGKYSGLQGIVDFLAIVKNLKADAKIFEDKGWADGHVYTGGLITQNGVYELAEKGPELVLNADDTEKILQAVKLMRGTVQMQMGAIDTKLFTSAGKVAEITPYIPPVETDSTGVQEVHIEANFPGVSVASEIEDALNSLVVQAAQYQSKYHR